MLMADAAVLVETEDDVSGVNAVMPAGEAIEDGNM